MARIRSVNPALFTDEAFVAMPALARLLLIGVWTECDDQGVFELKPLTLKMRIFPADDVDMDSLLAELQAKRWVCGFDVDGKAYGACRNFRKYQKPKAPKCWHPLPPGLRSWVGLARAAGGEHADPDPFPRSGETPPSEPVPFLQNGETSSLMEDGGEEVEEEEGSEGVSVAAREAPLPDGWAPTHTDLTWVVGQRSDLATVDIELQTEAFRLHMREHRQLSPDWSSRWRKWMLRAHAGALERDTGAAKRLGEGRGGGRGASAPIAEPWEQRVRGERADRDAGKAPTMWDRRRNDWGPKPDEQGCHAPAELCARFGFVRAAMMH
ncbi:hypothetical protein FHP25_35950 [Vineibacter terrae]|uniref:DUF1376 domain-containing protein n=1 Tax=Vineibacter terrae TaxID=2586908 RepID=A0A5C8PA60_9HYPH|nr:hypothetical protein [Vineibacter terrae]TXL70118.1 hypothetical protein FHP25_35950 [Vineibacter terrae]